MLLLLLEEVKKESAKSRVDFRPSYGLLIRGMKPLVLLIGKIGALYQNRTDVFLTWKESAIPLGEQRI